ncbi:hypothetical protein SAY86_020837 [Trapa natans]|uniref:Uncharacterized protein n=1 Tax=Trapa natans TaxID=22666 RepID=A0AAN7MRE4_TRANT|nr:hypothetical protein SAY86_020837 [Trapa natans]
MRAGSTATPPHTQLIRERRATLACLLYSTNIIMPLVTLNSLASPDEMLDELFKKEVLSSELAGPINKIKNWSKRQNITEFYNPVN